MQPLAPIVARVLDTNGENLVPRVRAETFRLGNAARQRGGMRVPNNALLIWSKVGPLCLDL